MNDNNVEVLTINQSEKQLKRRMRISFLSTTKMFQCHNPQIIFH